MPRKPAPRKGVDKIDKIITLSVLVLTFVGGAAVNGFVALTKVATIPYVEETSKQLKEYTDKVAAGTLREAFDHSDMNRQQMINEMKTMAVDVKSTSVKQDLMLDMVRNLQTVQQQQSSKR